MALLREVLLLALVTTCWCGETQVDVDQDAKILARAIDHASSKLFREAIMAGGDESVVSSPLGVMTLLALYAAGAGPRVRSDILGVLGTPNYTELYKSYSGVSRRLGKMDQSYLSLANKIYVTEDGQITPAFAKTAESYDSAVENVNFKDTKQTVAIINKWAEDKTNGVLKQAVSEDHISPDIAVALFNIIYFQGHWHVPFDAADTKEHDFTTSTKTTVKKPMMSLNQRLNYHDSEVLDAQLLELPYKEEGFRMVVILPKGPDGLPTLVEKVACSGILEEISKLKRHRTDIQVLLPKFEIKSDLDLNSLLPKIGLASLFTDGAAGILEGKEVAVSKAFQKAFIKVDEEGATAGAFTSVGVSVLSWTQPVEFHAKHPFLFYVLHEDTPLFVGAYQK